MKDERHNNHHRIVRPRNSRAVCLPCRSGFGIFRDSTGRTCKVLGERNGQKIAQCEFANRKRTDKSTGMGNESIIDTPNFAPMDNRPDGEGGFDWIRVLEVAILVALAVLLFSY